MVTTHKQSYMSNMFNFHQNNPQLFKKNFTNKINVKKQKGKKKISSIDKKLNLLNKRCYLKQAVKI